MGLGINMLEAFVANKADLKIAMLQKITKVVYPHSEMTDDGMLRSANKTPPRGFITPAPFDPKSSPY